MKRIRNFLSIHWPIVCIGFVWFLFSSPYILQGKVPYPSTYQVNHFKPWSHYEKYWGPVKNGAMPDVIDQIYPWKYFSISVLKTGHIPFWNPYSFAGNPHVANFQSAVFSPFNLLFFVLPFLEAWSIVILLQPLLAGMGMYLCMRQLSVSKLGATISSITYMFCGFLVVWMAYGTLAMAMAFLPLILYGIEKSFTKPTKVSYIIISIGLATSFFSGHFQTSLYVAAFSFLYFCFKFLTTKKKKTGLMPFCFFIIGIGISLVQILPSITLYQHSARSDILLYGGGIPFFYLITSFAPDFFGNPVTRNDWFGGYAELASFIGIVPLMLAWFSLYDKKNQYRIFFLCMGILALILAVDSPLREIIVKLNIPVISTSVPSRIIYLFSFSFAVLAGFGLDILQKIIIEKEKKKVIMVIGIGTILVMSAWIFGMQLSAEKTLIARKNLILPTVLFGLMTIVILVPLFLSKKVIMHYALCIMLFLSSFDSLRFASKWMPFDPRAYVFPNVPVIKTLQKEIGYGRVFGNLGGQVDTYYRLPTIEGYDPLYIQRFGEFIRSANNGKFEEAERSVVTLNRNAKYVDRVLDTLGVTHIFHPIADSHQAWAYNVWDKGSKYERIYQDDKFEIYRNNTALPRASLFYQYEVVEDDKKQIQQFYANDFDFRNVLILAEQPNVSETLVKAAGTANITRYEANTVEIQVDTEKPGLLFLADNYYPGWEVTVNGKSSHIFRANYTFRAVQVPAGRSTVRFTYSEY